MKKNMNRLRFNPFDDYNGNGVMGSRGDEEQGRRSN
jgi:hypothetical protein